MPPFVTFQDKKSLVGFTDIPEHCTGYLVVPFALRLILGNEGNGHRFSVLAMWEAMQRALGSVPFGFDIAANSLGCS
jgi:hypothetical protein